MFRSPPDDIVVVLELSAAGYWLMDYYPYESVTELDNERLRVVLRTRIPTGCGGLCSAWGDGRLTEPAELAAAVRADAAAALAQYDLYCA